MAQPKPGRYTAFCLFLVFAVIFADQYTKWLVMETVLRASPSMPDFKAWFTTARPIAHFITDREVFRTVAYNPWLSFVMVWNQGISFGMFDSASELAPLMFIAVSGVISLMLLAWLAFSRSMFVSISIALVVGGALGNMLDRMRFGAVVDFIDVHAMVHATEYHWPAFNLADSYIVLGAAMLAADSVFDGKKKEITA